MFKLIIHREELQVPEIYKYDFDDPKDPNDPKPWNNNGKADNDKYFNHGFTEETWKHHARDVVNLARAVPYITEL